MKRVLLATGLALALGVLPIAAQTRLTVAVGFGVPRSYVTGVVIVGRPHVYYPPRRAYSYRPPLFVARRGLRGGTTRDQRRDAVLGHLVRAGDEVGVAMPPAELDEADHLRHVLPDGLELVHRCDGVEYQDPAPP